MLIAAIGDTSYNIVLFLHVLLMFVALAPVFTHPFFDAQSTNYPNRAELFEGIVKRGMRIYGSSLIVSGLLGYQGRNADRR